WDATTGKPLTPTLAHHAPIVTVAFSADGGTVVTAETSAVRTWDVSLALPPPFLDWWSVADRSPYVLKDGVLVQRSDATSVDVGKPRRPRLDRVDRGPERGAVFDALDDLLDQQDDRSPSS